MHNIITDKTKVDLTMLRTHQHPSTPCELLLEVASEALALASLPFPLEPHRLDG